MWEVGIVGKRVKLEKEGVETDLRVGLEGKEAKAATERERERE